MANLLTPHRAGDSFPTRKDVAQQDATEQDGTQFSAGCLDNLFIMNMAATRTVATIPAEVRRRMMTAHGLGGVKKVRGIAMHALFSVLGMCISSHS